MMDGIRTWLLSVLTAGILCALADTLMPSGPVKRVGRLICGMVLMCTLLTPLFGLDPAEGERWLRDYFSNLEAQKGALEEQVDQEMKIIIEGKYAAYIVDKAAQMGLTCTAQVTCRAGEEGLFFPDWTQVSGLSSREEQERLSLVIREDLGVPEERQSFVSGEGAP